MKILPKIKSVAGTARCVLFGMTQKQCCEFIHGLYEILHRALKRAGVVPAQTDRELQKYYPNALVSGITYGGIAFPVLFRLLPKRGNSNTAERMKIIDRFIRLFGKSSIEFLVGDREFVDGKWLEYLNGERICYHLRIREYFQVKGPRTGKQFKAFWVFNR